MPSSPPGGVVEPRRTCLLLTLLFPAGRCARPRSTAAWPPRSRACTWRSCPRLRPARTTGCATAPLLLICRIARVHSGMRRGGTGGDKRTGTQMRNRGGTAAWDPRGVQKPAVCGRVESLRVCVRAGAGLGAAGGSSALFGHSGRSLLRGQLLICAALGSAADFFFARLFLSGRRGPGGPDGGAEEPLADRD